MARNIFFPRDFRHLNENVKKENWYNVKIKKLIFVIFCRFLDLGFSPEGADFKKKFLDFFLGRPN